MNRCFDASFRSLLALTMIVSSIQFPWANAQGGGEREFPVAYAKAARMQYESLQHEGISRDRARGILMGIFPAKADRAEIEQALADGPETIKFRRIEELKNDTYKLTMASGRSFTVQEESKRGYVRVNGRKVAFVDSSFRAAAAALKPALHSTFVVRHLLQEVLLPTEVHAATAIEYGLVAAMFGIAVTTIWTAFKGKSSSSTAEVAPPVQLKAALEKFVATCQSERESMKRPFELSETGFLSSIIPPDLNVKECDVYAEKAAKNYRTVYNKTVKIEDYQAVCERAADFQACSQKYQADSLAAFSRPGSSGEARPAAPPTPSSR